MAITKIAVVYTAAPQIYLEIDGVITSGGRGKNEIQFNELGNYVSLFEQQQTALGEYISVSRSTYTINNKAYPAILFTPTDTPTDPIAGTTQFQLNDVAFDGARNLAGGLNCASIPSFNTITFNNAPFVCTFNLPRRGGDHFELDYTIPDYVELKATVDLGDTTLWNCVCVVWYAVDTPPATVNFVNADNVKLTVTNAVPGVNIVVSANTLETTNSRMCSEPASLIGLPPIIIRSTNYFVSLLNDGNIYSAFNVQRKKNGVNVGAPEALALTGDNIAVLDNGTIDELEFSAAL